MMSTMLQEIARWQLPKRREATAHQWSSWARSLVERHGRITLRHGPLALTLAERLGSVYLLSQRWENYAWQFSPQISLAIRASLRDTLDNERSIILPHPTQPELRRIIAPAHARASARLQGFSIPGGYDHWDVHLFVREQRHLLRSASSRPLMPLSYVFGRLNPPQPATHSHQSLSVPASLQLARRVAEERQRVEVRPQRTTVVRQQTGVLTTATGRAAMASALEIRPAMPAAAHAGQHMNTLTQVQAHTTTRADAWPAPPAVNIEQLTEQVMRQLDHRIMAYRERMGRPV